MSRYIYLGDSLTDPTLAGRPCDPVYEPTGKVLKNGAKKGSPARQVVVFADGREVGVLARRLRLTAEAKEARDG